MRKIIVGMFTVVLACAPLSIAWGQSPQQVGRYQLVSDSSTMFMVDTVTGRAWRYTILTKAGGEKAESPCQGLAACLIEVDRVRLTDSGWVSEIFPAKR